MALLQHKTEPSMAPGFNAVGSVLVVRGMLVILIVPIRLRNSSQIAPDQHYRKWPADIVVRGLNRRREQRRAPTAHKGSDARSMVERIMCISRCGMPVAIS